ncbi:MAG: ATP-grasp domain-containing protein [Piscinibacter sp.]
MMRVFVYEYLSGGGLVDGDPAATAVLMPQGLAMRDALVADLLASGDCDVTAATCVCAGPLPAGASEALAHDGEMPEDFAARMAAGHDAAWIVAPETGGCLAAFERAIGAPRWLGCDARSIAIGASKSATLRHLAAHELPTPWRHQALATRWVVKPDDGAGSVDTHLHADRAAAQADLAGRHARGVSACLEPWVDGEALSISLLCELGQAELLGVNRQRIVTLDDGSLRYDGVAIDVWPRREPRRRTLATLASRIAAALPGLRGFVGVDLVWHPAHGPVVIEINPRLTCAYVGLSQRLGRNLAAEVLGLQRLERIDA